MKVLADVDGVTQNIINQSALGQGNVFLYVVRSGIPVWSGIITGVAENWTTSTLQISAVNFFARYDALHLLFNKSYANKTASHIANDMLESAHIINEGGNPLVRTVVYSDTGQTFDMDYHYWDYNRFSEVLEDLALIDGGIDFYMRPATGLNGSNQRYYATDIEIHYPKKGTRKSSFVFYHGVNCTVLTRDKDTASMANRVFALGEGQEQAMVVGSYADPACLGTYPVYETTIDRKRIDNVDALNAHAKLHTRRVCSPVERLTLVANTGDATTGQTFAYGAFEPGDDVRVIAEHGYGVINDFYRVSQVSLDVDNEGSERMTVHANNYEATLQQ